MTTRRAVFRMLPADGVLGRRYLRGVLGTGKLTSDDENHKRCYPDGRKRAQREEKFSVISDAADFCAVD